MAQKRLIELPYEPRSAFEQFHDREQRWACIVAHRRAGKTVACINDLLKAALLCKKQDPRFAYIAPYYAQAKDVVWNYLKHFAAPVPGVSFHEQELRADLPNGGRVRLYGADNYDRLRGVYFDGIVLDEYADMDPRAWAEVIRPALSDRAGWAVFIGTPKGHNSFYDIAKEAKENAGWYALTLKASETGLVNAEELADAARQMTTDQYAQEYECSFDAAIQGAIYRDEIMQAEADARITAVPWRADVEVFTSWDLGFDDDTVVWFGHQVGREIHWIDVMEVRGLGLTEIVKRLKDKPYVYGKHYLPHDVEQTELGSGRTRRDTLQGLGMRDIVTAPREGVWERINATRVMFNRFWFDRAKCQNALEKLKQYRREWDADRKVFREKPAHDENSHAADAIGTFAQAFRDTTKVNREHLRPRFGTMA